MAIPRKASRDFRRFVGDDTIIHLAYFITIDRKRQEGMMMRKDK
jgi:hypothetical protein